MSIFIKYIYILTHEKVDVKVKQGNTNKTPYLYSSYGQQNTIHSVHLTPFYNGIGYIQKRW